MEDEKDKIIEALHEIIDAYEQEERYVPGRVVNIYMKYHIPWERKNHPEYYNREALEEEKEESCIN